MYELSNENPYLTQAGQLFTKILSELSTKVDHIFISFDTDSINSKYMPGVSAPSVIGGLSSL
jgi:arginase family enzyme